MTRLPTIAKLYFGCGFEALLSDLGGMDFTARNLFLNEVGKTK
jgi:hypothetical protein